MPNSAFMIRLTDDGAYDQTDCGNKSDVLFHLHVGLVLHGTVVHLDRVTMSDVGDVVTPDVAVTVSDRLI